MVNGEDWKGDISIPKKTVQERRVENQRIAQSMAHKRRTMQGTNMSKAGGPWARAIRVWVLQNGK